MKISFMEMDTVTYWIERDEIDSLTFQMALSPYPSCSAVVCCKSKSGNTTSITILLKMVPIDDCN